MSWPERTWLEPVVATLDAAQTARQVFFRDDDGGWNDEALAHLLDRFERWELPLDVAVIPSEVTPELSRDLVARCRNGMVHVHQHGYTHANHEPRGRKCEFGVRRSADRQRADIVAGRALLAAQFGDVLEPVFTPPWNRCSQKTAEIAAELGFAVLSRDHTAAPFTPGTIREVGVTVDWFGKPAASAGVARSSVGASQRRWQRTGPRASCCTMR